jgi:FkbM family methyltransferase
LALSAVTSGSIVYDVGANAGYYTLALIRSCRTVYAVEPFAVDLTAHIAKNELRDRATVIPMAVGEHRGTVRFSDDSPSMRHQDDDGPHQVEVVTLDSLNLPDPQFVKMDIEGAEAAALRGMTTLIARSHPTLLIATHGVQCHTEVVTQLHAHRYSVREVGPSALLAT